LITLIVGFIALLTALLHTRLIYAANTSQCGITLADEKGQKYSNILDS
jgi:hypothetical protein